MNKFSAPEDLFGPVSITALKKDEFSRKVEGFLPEADFAFLDEIWKSSPAILNSLLTILNERKYKNGKDNMDVALTYVISASNETPPENQGLEALYDRFPIRLFVSPIDSKLSRADYLNNTSDMKFEPQIKLSIEDVKEFNKGVVNIKINEQALLAFMECIDECHSLETPIYISDRRQKQILNILRYQALYSGQDEVNIVSMVLLKHFLWEKESDMEIVESVLDRVLPEYLAPQKLYETIEIFARMKDEIMNSLFEDKMEKN